MTFVVVLLGWIFSLCVHEYAHARTAYAGGDTSVRDKGYLSFNPLRYTDPIYSMVMPLVFLALGGIGLPGGAVYIETHRLRTPSWRSAVSAAGPLSNLGLALVLALTLRLDIVAGSIAGPALAFLAYLNVMAMLFNILPIPPLDGYGVIAPHLAPDLRARFDRVSRWGIVVVFVLLWFVPPAYRGFWSVVSLIASVLGVPLDLASHGLQAFTSFLSPL